MSEVQPVLALGPWPPYVLLLIAAGCFVAGLWHGFRAVWLWRHRDTPISDPLIAKVLEGVKPPPYALYAAGWCSAGLVATVVAIVLSH